MAKQDTRKGEEVKQEIKEESNALENMAENQRTRPRRNRRKPFQRQVLKFKTRPGYERRVIDYDPMEIERLKEEDWTPVHDDDLGGTKTAATGGQQASVVTKPIGLNRRGILMEKPKEWYDEDQQIKEIERKRRLETMRKPNRKDGFYGDIDFGKNHKRNIGPD